MNTHSSEKKKLNVIIADDHPLYRKGLETGLRTIDLTGEISEATNGAEVIELLRQKKYDIVFMDITMPVCNGIQSTQTITAEFPDVAVIAVSIHDDENNILSMLSAGARGYLFKDTSIEEVRAAMLSVSKGELFVSPEISEFLLQKTLHKRAAKKQLQSKVEFTGYEMKTMLMICNEMTTKEIADKLSLSNRTIESYRHKLLKKTNSKNSVGLVRYCIKNNLFAEKW